MSADTARIRANLDEAIAEAIPFAGGSVRPLLYRLRNELARVDEQRAATAARIAAWPRKPSLTTGSSPSGGEGQ